MNLHMITGTEKTNQLRSNYTSTLQLNLFDDAIFMAVLDRREASRKQVLSGSATLKGFRIAK
jgi:hypothetical protein